MTNFSEDIVKAIDDQKISPKPHWHFLLKRSVLWVLAIFSITIGGIAFSVASYVFFDNDGANVLKQSSVRELARSIPYIWLVVLGIFTSMAYIGFRKTRRGYRYATALVVSGVIVMSIVFGFILEGLDFGQSVHKYLIKNTDLYDALIYSSEDVDK